MAFSSSRDAITRRLFRRQCIECPNTSPSCPVCAEDELCSYITETCTSCASTTCVPRSTIDRGQTTDAAPSRSSAAGPVAGGVIAGVVVIAIVTFLVWKCCIKPRRQRHQQEAAWMNPQTQSEKDGEAENFRSHRQSTQTVASVASSAMTRASNVIQIAYIPGVTNRSIHSTPDLVPPVPPIPAAAGGSGASTPNIDSDDKHFFTPNDLRNSHADGEDRRFFMPSHLRNSNMTSYTDRNSVASTVYRSNAIVSPVPAQMAARGKATAVSVRSRTSPNPSRPTSPPALASVSSSSSLNPHRNNSLNTNSSIVGRVGQPRPVQITRKGSATHAPIYELDGSGSEASFSPHMIVPDRKYDSASPQFSYHSATFDDQSSDDDQWGKNSGAAAASRRLMPKTRMSEATTIHEEDSPMSPAELPSYRNSSDVSALNTATTHQKSPSLNQIIEEAALSASREPLSGSLGTFERHELGDNQPEVSPFSDHHAARTP